MSEREDWREDFWLSGKWIAWAVGGSIVLFAAVLMAGLEGEKHFASACHARGGEVVHADRTNLCLRPGVVVPLIGDPE